jgi:hypothetical protein
VAKNFAMKAKPRKNPNQGPKDFKKKKHAVGALKLQSNETQKGSLRSKRVKMPTQRLSTNSDQLSEILTGLRHYNEKKRLDAMNSLIRSGHESIADESMGDVVTSMGILLVDIDDLVRSKAANFLFALISNRDRLTVSPFVQGLGSLARAALANVAPNIRNDAVAFIKRCAPLGLFTSSDTQAYLKSLFEISTTLQSFNSRTSRNTDDQRQLVFSTVEIVLQSLADQKEEIGQGSIDPSHWTMSSIFQSVLWPPAGMSMELNRFMSFLHRQGESATRDRVETLAEKAGLLVKADPIATPANGKQSAPKRKPSGRGSGTVFSKLSLLTRDDSD